jgi:uncharacterized protein
MDGRSEVLGHTTIRIWGRFYIEHVKDSRYEGVSISDVPLKSLEYIDQEKLMAISPELLEILRCPKCKSKVELKPDGSGLKCTDPECALVYPIRDDIPVMLVDEAKTDN